MASNKLMEAAADILTGSKKSAPSMPPQKLEGEVQDLGGPTPQNAKPDDDSNKIHASSKAPDNSGKNRSTISTKPSAASPDKQEMLGKGRSTMKEEEESDVEDFISEEEPEEVSFKEDIDALFADDSTISEEFKSRVTTIFEARVFDRVQRIEEEIESKYASMLEEAVEEIKTDLTEKVDDYLNYVVEQWMEENQIAIESGLRSEITEEFIAGLRNLFAEHYIDVPEEKVDLVDELAGKVEELEEKLNEEIETNIQYKKAILESVKREAVYEVCKELTETQVEKMKSLAESVEFSTEEQLIEKLESIRENYFPSNIKQAEETQLHEQVEDEQPIQKNKKSNDPFINAVVQSISKTKI
jgi:gas vesicle protein